MISQTSPLSSISSSQTLTEIPSSLSASSVAEVALRVNVLTDENESIKTDVSKLASEIEFSVDYDFWQKETAPMSANNYKNIHFDAIVSRGEESVPFIYRELLKGPSMIYHALELIYPEKIQYRGYVSLVQARRIWLRILRKHGLV